MLQVEPLATCHTHVDKVASFIHKTVAISTRNPTTCVGRDPLAAKMERGRVGLMSTSLLAASGEPSLERILYASCCRLSPSPPASGEAIIRRPTPAERYYRAHWLVEPLATCHTCADNLGSWKLKT